MTIPASRVIVGSRSKNLIVSNIFGKWPEVLILWPSGCATHWACSCRVGLFIKLVNSWVILSFSCWTYWATWEKSASCATLPVRGRGYKVINSAPVKWSHTLCGGNYSTVSQGEHNGCDEECQFHGCWVERTCGTHGLKMALDLTGVPLQVDLELWIISQQWSHPGWRSNLRDELTWMAGGGGPDGGFLKDSLASYSPALLTQRTSPLPTVIGPDGKKPRLLDIGRALEGKHNVDPCFVRHLCKKSKSNKESPADCPNMHLINTDKHVNTITSGYQLEHGW